MFFESWSRVWVLAIAAPISYGALVAVLRISGKRTLGKLDAFDFVVTIALGSVLATSIVSREVTVVEGVTALGLLVALQFLVALASARWQRFHGVVTSQPTAVVVHGEILHEELRRCRVTEDQVAAAVRQAGRGTLVGIDLVVLETDGSFSVVTDLSDGSAAKDVAGAALPAGSSAGRAR